MIAISLISGDKSTIVFPMTQKFRCIVADPPWELKLGKTSPVDSEAIPWNHDLTLTQLEYPTMSVKELKALKVPADRDAHCYIWTINAHLEATYEIARAWGFRPVTLITWIKSPMGLGLGGTFSNTSEFILFCRRGTLSAKRRVDRTWFGWPRGRHSEKPEEFQTIVESVSPGPYLEMFARRKRPGWSSWGNEVESDVDLGGQGLPLVEQPSPFLLTGQTLSLTGL